jgi:hypothetical protein
VRRCSSTPRSPPQEPIPATSLADACSPSSSRCHTRAAAAERRHFRVPRSTYALRRDGRPRGHGHAHGALHICATPRLAPLAEQ